MNIRFWHVRVKVLLKFLCYVLDTSARFSAYLPVSFSVRIKQPNNRSKFSHEIIHVEVFIPSDVKSNLSNGHFTCALRTFGAKMVKYL